MGSADLFLLQRFDDKVAEEDDCSKEGEHDSESDGQAAAVDPDSGPCLLAFEFGVALVGNGRVVDQEVVIDAISSRVKGLARGFTGW
jgi:hypothetical protein